MSYIYHLFFFNPLYNFLLLMLKVAPWMDVGVAVILITFLVRLILYPLSRKAVLTQVKMAEIGPQVEKIKQQYKDKPDEQARQTLALYREKGVNPFSGILVILIQIPVIIALYRIFLRLPQVDISFLYSFVQAPTHINTVFLGFFDLTTKSLVIALLAALATLWQLTISTKGQQKPQGNSFGDNLAASMQGQMKYFFPVIVFFIAYKASGVLALYWLTTNLFSVAQELYVRRKLRTPIQA